jgi:hypothetical protein
MVICVVGFRMDKANSLGYRKVETARQAGEQVERFLMMGADVISIRKIKPKGQTVFK